MTSGDMAESSKIAQDGCVEAEIVGSWDFMSFMSSSRFLCVCIVCVRVGCLGLLACVIVWVYLCVHTCFLSCSCMHAVCSRHTGSNSETSNLERAHVPECAAISLNLEQKLSNEQIDAGGLSLRSSSSELRETVATASRHRRSTISLCHSHFRRCCHGLSTSLPRSSVPRLKASIEC